MIFLSLQVSDKATLYLNTLEGDGSIVETNKDVKDFRFGSFDISLFNVETSLKVETMQVLLSVVFNIPFFLVAFLI